MTAVELTTRAGPGGRISLVVMASDGGRVQPMRKVIAVLLYPSGAPPQSHGVRLEARQTLGSTTVTPVGMPVLQVSKRA